MGNNMNLLRRAEICQTPVALYGAGKYGRIALANIRKIYPQMDIKYFIDDDLVRNNRDVEGIQVMTLDKVSKNRGGGIIIISNYYITETLGKLERAGVDLSDVFFSNEILIEPIERGYIREKRKELEKVYSLLEDYESKLIYKTIVESRFTYNIDILSRTCRKGQYFPTDIFRFTENEVFIDGGAFDGDTIDSFKQIVQGRFRYIYAFEPDCQNYDNLAANHQDESIRLFNLGLYDQDGDVSFSSGKGGSSQIKPGCEDTIKVCCFDNLDIPDRNVTFVKMDIEGSERNALEGMKNTIYKYRPKLGICIYHKFEDLWEIPLFIKQLVPEYKLYIRNHTTYLDEIVLYATI